MRWIKYPLLLAGGTLGVTLGIAAIHPMLAIAPKLTEAHPLLQELKSTRSLDGLYGLRDRIQAQFIATPSGASRKESRDLNFTLAQLSQRVGQRIQGEQQAEAAYQRAIELALQATATRQSGKNTLQTWQQEEFLWQTAIERLQTIPADSLQADAAQTKIVEYTQNLKSVAQKVDRGQSQFLADIAATTGDPAAVRISLCHLLGECRDFQGNVPPASPASLIKLPMAVVLMHKVTTENIDLQAPIYIDPHNFTENADDAQIFVGQKYPLQEVMARMINESNNIATNQLVDYLGWDYINTTLTEMGFPNTAVHTKLVGDRTYPTHNRGTAPNTTTTNELTEMMRQIYTFQHPGDGEILDALVSQYDHDFGYTALKSLDRQRVSWIGEKTGQNSKVIGSTLAVKVDDERYVLTVTLDHSANQFMLRQIIQDVVQHLLNGGHLVPQKRR